jgi:serine O-acetyltransferase
MFIFEGSSAIEKLKMDVRRSCLDHNLHGHYASFKLMIVVDFWPVLYFRLIEYCFESKGIARRLLRAFLLPFKPIVEGASGARIYADAKIGGGLLLHQSSGVVIAPGAELGENCTLFSGACVVYKANNQGFASPKIGSNVRLTVGCKVIGNVVIGDNVTVGANAVVTKNVPDDSVVVGIPAQIIAIK